MPAMSTNSTVGGQDLGRREELGQRLEPFVGDADDCPRWARSLANG
jgi:hypothetical protein